MELRTYAIVLSTLCSGWLAGASLGTFLAAAAAAAAAAWLPLRTRSGTHVLFVNLDPQKPDPALLMEAFRTSLALIRRTGHPARLRISAASREPHPVFRVDITRDGDLELLCDSRRSALKQPGAWLADHPVPLSLPRTRSVTLSLEPCGAGRVRASLAPRAAPSPCQWGAPVSAAVAALAFDLPCLLAAALGFATHACLLHNQSDRAQQNACV